MTEAQRSPALKVIWRWAGIISDLWGRVKALFIVFSIASAVLLGTWYFLLKSVGVIGIVALLAGVAFALLSVALALEAMNALRAEISRPTGISPEELQEALREHTAKAKRQVADRSELVDTLVNLANRSKSGLADQLQALLDEGVRIHETYSPLSILAGSVSNADIQNWTRRVEALLANRPRDLALFRLSASHAFGIVSWPLPDAERGALNRKLNNLETIIKRARSGQ